MPSYTHELVISSARQTHTALRDKKFHHDIEVQAYTELKNLFFRKSKKEIASILKNLYQEKPFCAYALGKFLLANANDSRVRNILRYFERINSIGAAFDINVHLSHRTGVTEGAPGIILIDQTQEVYDHFITAICNDPSLSDSTLDKWADAQIAAEQEKQAELKSEITFAEKKHSVESKSAPTLSLMEYAVDAVVTDHNTATANVITAMNAVLNTKLKNTFSDWHFELDRLFSIHSSTGNMKHVNFNAIRMYLLNAPKRIDPALIKTAQQSIDQYLTVSSYHDLLNKELKSCGYQHKDNYCDLEKIDQEAPELQTDKKAALEANLLAIATAYKFNINYAHPIKQIISNEISQLKKYIKKYKSSTGTYDVRKHQAAVDLLKIFDEINAELHLHPNLDPSKLISLANQITSLKRELETTTNKANESIFTLFRSHKGGWISTLWNKNTNGVLDILNQKVVAAAQSTAREKHLLKHRTEDGLEELRTPSIIALKQKTNDAKLEMKR